MNIFTSFRYKKNGLPLGLLDLHAFLLEDIISYFENGKFIKRKTREARKAIKQAIKFGKKKKALISEKTDPIIEHLEELFKEWETTQRVLEETATEMKSLMDQIKEERIMSISLLVDEASESFKERKIDNGLELLTKATNELDKKLLMNTRKNILTGLGSEVKKLRSEVVEEQNLRKLKKKNK
jgi:hypothetical protein